METIKKIFNKKIYDFEMYGLYMTAYTNANGEIKKLNKMPGNPHQIRKIKNEYLKPFYHYKDKTTYTPNAVAINTENLSIIDVDDVEKCVIINKLLVDCEFIIKTRKGYHFYFNKTNKLISNNELCNIADIGILQLFFCPEYIHNETGEKFSYGVEKNKKIVDMPEYAIDWCNQLILSKNLNKDTKINNKNINKSTDKIVIQPDLEINKIDIQAMDVVFKIYFDNGYFNEYKSWITVAYMARHCNNSIECFELFDFYSRQVIINGIEKYKNTDINDNKKIFYQKNNYNLNYDTKAILYKCKKLNPELVEKKLSHLFKSKYEDLYNIVNNKFIYPNDNSLNYIYDNWVDNKKVLMIKSAYGTGKTYGFKKIIENFNFKKILFITYRQSLANSLEDDLKNCFGFESYLNQEINIDKCDRAIVQLDSLYKLQSKYNYETQESTVIKYDLIVLDEIEGLLNHLSYEKINQFYIYNILEKLVVNTNKILCLDGDLGERSMDFISNITDSYNIYINEFKPNKKHFIFSDNITTFDDSINDDLKRGKNLVLICMLCSDSEKYYEYYKDKYKVIIHNSKEKNREILRNVNKNWSQCNLLIYTPSVESGIDFNIVNYFYKCYSVISNKSTCPRAFNQMLNRVRYFENNDVLLLLGLGVGFVDKNLYTYTYNEIKNEKYKEIEINNMNNILIHNDTEEINKTNYFISTLLKSFTEKGHTYTYLKDTDPDYIPPKENNKKITCKKIIDADEIDNAKYEYLCKIQKCNQDITREEYYAKLKYFYKLFYKVDILDIDFLNNHYDKFGVFKNNKKLLLTLEERIKPENHETYKKINFKKIDTIRQFIKILGLDIDDFKKSITHEQLEKGEQEIIKIMNTKEYKTTFNCGRQEITKDNLYLNQILLNYGLEFESKQKRKQVNKVITSTQIYNLKNLDIINNWKIRCEKLNIERSYILQEIDWGITPINSIKLNL